MRGSRSQVYLDNPQIEQITQISFMKIMNQPNPQTYAIIGIVMEIHRQVGFGFLEPVYFENN